MWGNKCCNDTTIKGALLSSDPTKDDINYPPGFIAWTEDEKVYFHIGSGRWVDISASGGGGGSGVDSVNGITGAVTVSVSPPLKLTPSGKDLKITLEEKYIKTVNGISPTESGDFTIDKTDPITITPGENKVTVGSQSSAGGITSISLNGTKIPADSEGNVPLETDNGIQGIVE